MVPFERAMAVSYRLTIVTIALSLTVRSHFAIECLRCSNQQVQNLGRKGLTDTIRYDTIEEINVDSKAEYTA